MSLLPPVKKPNNLTRAIAMYSVAVFFYFYEFLLRVATQPLQPQLEQDFNIDYADYGKLAAFYYYSYALLQLPIGAFTDKFGPRRLLTFAILLCAGSTLLFAQTQDFNVACFARLLIGAGSAFAFISCLKIATVWFPSQWFPIISGLTLAIGSAGPVVGGGPIALMLDYMDWRQLMTWIGWVGLVLGVVSWLVIRDHNPLQPHLTRQKSDENGRLSFWNCMWHVVKRPENWLIGAYAFLATAPTDAFGGAWGALFLRDVHGINNIDANWAATMTFLGMVFGSPLISWSSDAVRSRRIPMIIGAVLSGLILCGLLYYPTISAVMATVLFFFYGVFGSYILCFVVARDINLPLYVGATVGFINFMSMLGSALLTRILGPLLDAVRDNALDYTAVHYHKVFIILPLFYAVSAFIVIPLIRESFGKHKP